MQLSVHLQENYATLQPMPNLPAFKARKYHKCIVKIQPISLTRLYNATHLNYFDSQTNKTQNVLQVILTSYLQ